MQIPRPGVLARVSLEKDALPDLPTTKGKVTARSGANANGTPGLILALSSAVCAGIRSAAAEMGKFR